MYLETLVAVLPLVGLVGLGVFGWLMFWRWYDYKRTEPLGLMVMAATWGAILTFFLKGFVDRCGMINISYEFLFGVVFLEEAVKAFATVNTLESVRKKFDEVSDGIIYGVAVALGFVMVETIFYLNNVPNFWGVYMGRLIYSMPAHMVFGGIFGLYYAQAYLNENIIGKGKKRQQPPLAFLGNILEASTHRLKERERNFVNVHREVLVELFRVITLHITREEILMGKRKHKHWAGELVMEGFLLALYLHLLYNFFLASDSAWVRSGGLIMIVGMFGVLLWRFRVVEKGVKKG